MGQIEDRAFAWMEQREPIMARIARLQGALEKRVEEFRLIPIKRPL